MEGCVFVVAYRHAPFSFFRCFSLSLAKGLVPKYALLLSVRTFETVAVLVCTECVTIGILLPGVETVSSKSFTCTFDNINNFRSMSFRSQLSFSSSPSFSFSGFLTPLSHVLRFCPV